MTDKELLEQILDRRTMCEVLTWLSEISAAKATHIRTNWQHTYHARSWERVSHDLDNLTLKHGGI